MTSNNLFEQTEDDQIPFDENKDYLDELVGEGKKFKDVSDLAKGKAYSDSYINTLILQRDEMRNEYKKLLEESKSRARLEELLTKIEEKDQQLSSREKEIPMNSNEDKQQPAFDPNQLESLIDSKIQQRELTKKEQENYNTVRDRLQERFGKNYGDVLKEQAESLGLSDEEINLMARKNPNLFFKTFDLTTPQKQDFQSPPRSEQRSSLAPKTEKRNWNYYLKLKEKDPMAWFDPKIAVQMDKDLQAMGQDFYSP